MHALRLPNTCYFALPDIEGETLVTRLEKESFAIARGAACSSVTPGQSRVLDAMEVEPMLATLCGTYKYGEKQHTGTT